MAVTEITNLTIDRGASFAASFNLFNNDKSGFPIDGIISSSARIRKHSKSDIYENFKVIITTSPPANITIELNSEQTAKLELGRNYFDVFITTSGNNRNKFVTGTVIVNDSLVYDDSYTSAQRLDELTDVNISEIGGEINNYILVYNSATNTWDAANPDTLLSAAVSDPISPGLPEEFINELDNQIDIDAGLFPNE